MAASSLIPSYPPIASATVPGLISTAAQAFAGLKTFSGGAVVSLPTAGASDVSLKIGSTAAAPAGSGGFKALQVVTGLGGTEVEHFAIRPEVGGSDYTGTVVINPAGSPVNKPGIAIGSGPGFGGNVAFGSGVGGGSLIGEYNGAYLYFVTTNRGMRFAQNYNAFDPDSIFRWEVSTANGGVSSSVPLFDFRSLTALQSGQKFARYQVNGSEVFSVNGSGDMLAAGLWFGDATRGYNIAYGVKYLSASALLGFFNANNAAYLGIGLGNGLAQCSGSFQAGGNITGGTLYSTTNTIGDSAGTPRITFPGGTGILNLLATNGTSASDVGVKAGTTTADGSVNAGAKLFSLRTGLGGSEVEKLHVVKDGTIELTGSGVGIVLASPNGTRYRITVTNAGAINVAAA